MSKRILSVLLATILCIFPVFQVAAQTIDNNIAQIELAGMEDDEIIPVNPADSDPVDDTDPFLADDDSSSELPDEGEEEVLSPQSEDGLLSMFGITRVFDAYHQITALVLEFDREIIAPESPGEAFSFVDFGTADLKEDYERRESSEADIAAVYTNSAPSMRDDRQSVDGKYLIVELEPMTGSHYSEELGMQIPDNVAGLATWRKVGESVEWWRRDFSELEITLRVDIKDADGVVVAQPGALPTLQYEDLVNLELDEFEQVTLPSPNGNYEIHYSVYFPDSYDPTGNYPLVVNVTGNGGRLNYAQQDEGGNILPIGAHISRDRAALAWMNAEEDVIIVSPQIWSNAPSEWNATTGNAVDDTGYLVDYFLDNYAVNPDRVYAIGSSFGTMHLSQVMTKYGDRFAAYIQCNGYFTGATTKFTSAYSRSFVGWTREQVLALGEEDRLPREQYIDNARNVMGKMVENRVALYVWHGVNDETFNVTRGLSTYEMLRELYQEAGLSAAEIDELVQIYIIEDEEFHNLGICEKHCGSKFAVSNPELLSWTLSKTRTAAASENGIRNVTGFTKVFDAYHQVAAVAIEYDEEIAVPVEGTDAFSIVDYASARLRDEEDRREASEGIVAAVYTNSSPALRDGQDSVAGNYLIVEFEPTNSVIYDEELGYIPNHATGFATWRNIGDSSDWRRLDFSELEIKQLVDVKNSAGEVVSAATTLPAIAFDKLVNFEIDEFVTTTLPSPNGNYDINYSYYLPENYSLDKLYPMIVNVSGNGGRADYEHQDETGRSYSLGANISRDRAALAWLELDEDVIVISPQPWRNEPSEWEADAPEDTAYLIDYFIENYSADPDRVYAIGSSYGTSHLSTMLRSHADKIAAYIQCNGSFSGVSNKFIGEYARVFTDKNVEYVWSLGDEVRLNPEEYLDNARAALQDVIDNRVPIYVWHGVNDQTAAVTSGFSTYEILRELYAELGMSEAEMDELAKIYLIEDEEFYSMGIVELHSGSKVAAAHPEMLSWTLTNTRRGSQSVDGIVNVTGITQTFDAYHQVAAVAIEYDREIVVPEAGAGSFSIIDYGTADLRETFEIRPYSETTVAAIYTNNQPSMREDKQSVAGSYLIVELTPTGKAVYDEEYGGYIPDHVTAQATWRKLGEAVEWRRLDFSELEIRQLVDVLDADGQTVASPSLIPTLKYEELVNLQIDEFEQMIVPSPNGDYDIYYNVYFPEKYDPNGSYPLVLNVSGSGGRLNYEQQDENGNLLAMGADVSRDRAALTWLDADEDVIVITQQPMTNGPVRTDDVADTVYLVDYYIENFAVDADRVYCIGSSAGGMHLSRVLAEYADRFTAYIMCNTRYTGLTNTLTAEYSGIYTGWTKDQIEALGDETRRDRAEYIDAARAVMGGMVENRVALYVWHGVNDQTLSVAGGISAYEILRELYADAGLSEEEIDELVKIYLIDDDEFHELGIAKYHCGSKYAAAMPEMREWTLRQRSIELVPAESVSISANSVTNLKLGTTLQLSAEVSPAQATNQTVLWSSSNESILTVSDTGEVTALRTGSARITATTSNGVTKMITVRVSA